MIDMGTVHEDSNRKAVEERFMEEPEYARLICSAAKKLNSGGFKGELPEVVMQEYERVNGGKWTIYSAACYAEIHTLLRTGRIGATSIRVGCGPHSDAMMAENQKILEHVFSETLSLQDCDSREVRPTETRFDVQLQGGPGDSDGRMKWDPVLELAWMVDPGDGSEQEAHRSIGPRSVPVEVGYTKASRTLMHLIEERGVARWPYDSENITILVVLDNTLWVPDTPYFARKMQPELIPSGPA